MDNNSSDIKSCESIKNTTSMSTSDQGFEKFELNSFKDNFHLSPSDSYGIDFSMNKKSNGSVQNSMFSDSAYSSPKDKFNFGKSNFSDSNDFYDSSSNNFCTDNFNENYSLPKDAGFSMQTDDLSDIFTENNDHKDSGHCEEFDEVDIANIKNFLGNYGKEMKERMSQTKNMPITDSTKPFTFKMPKVSTVSMMSSESSTMLPL